MLGVVLLFLQRHSLLSYRFQFSVLFLPYQPAMMSPLKIVFFAFISFATLALAIPTSEAQAGYQDPKVVIYNANAALRTNALPLGLCCLPSTFRTTHAHYPCVAYLTRANATSDCLEPVIDAITVTVVQLISELRLSSLSACGCSASEIVELIAITLEVIMTSFSLFLVRSCFNRSSSALSTMRTVCILV